MERSGSALTGPCWLEGEDFLFPIVIVTPVCKIEDCNCRRTATAIVSDARRMSEPMVPQLLTSCTEKHFQRERVASPSRAPPAIVLALRGNSELFDGQL